VQPDWVPACHPLVAKHQQKPGRRQSLYNTDQDTLHLDNRSYIGLLLLSKFLFLLFQVY
jgi:hypothetical protein